MKEEMRAHYQEVLLEDARLLARQFLDILKDLPCDLGEIDPELDSSRLPDWLTDSDAGISLWLTDERLARRRAVDELTRLGQEIGLR